MANLKFFTKDMLNDLQKCACRISSASKPRIKTDFDYWFGIELVKLLNPCFVHIKALNSYVIRKHYAETGENIYEHVPTMKFKNIPGIIKVSIKVPRSFGDTVIMSEIKLGEMWLKTPGHLTYDQITFSPGIEAPPQFYNTWQGFHIKHDPKKDVNESAEKCKMLLKHVRNRWCNGDESLYKWVMSWMASILQKPGHKWKSCIVLRGTQGVGKGIIVEKFAKIIGRNYYAHIGNKNDILGRFNGILDEKILIFCDEIGTAYEKQQSSFLKVVISEDEINIEKKHVNIRRINNYARLILASNNSWVIPAGQNARRFCVLEVNDDLLKPENKEDLYDILDTDAEDLANILYNWDISDFNGNHIPKTEGLKIQQSLSLSRWAQWLHTILSAGEINIDGNNYILDEPNKMPSSLFYEAYKRSNRSYPLPQNVLLKNVYKATGTHSVRCYENGRQIRFIQWEDIEEMRKTFEEQYHAGFDEGDEEYKEPTIKDRINSEITKLQALLFQIPESERKEYYRLMDAIHGLTPTVTEPIAETNTEETRKKTEPIEETKEPLKQVPKQIGEQIPTSSTDTIEEDDELTELLKALDE